MFYFYVICFFSEFCPKEKYDKVKTNLSYINFMHINEMVDIFARRILVTDHMKKP